MTDEINQVEDAEVIDVTNETPEDQPKEPMVVSLSKANKIRNLLKSRMQDLETQIAQASSKRIHIDQDDDQDSFQAARAEKITTLNNLITAHGNLNYINKCIKVAIGKANAQAGVSEAMATIDQLVQSKRPIDYILRMMPYDPKDVERVFAHNVKTREFLETADPSTVRTQAYKTASIGLITDQDLEAERVQVAALDKAIRELEEKRNELNYQTTIEIPGEFVEIIKLHQII